MILAGILRELRALPEESCAETAARSGFLKWLMSLPAQCPMAAAARMAERRAAPLIPENRAVALFCTHLRSAQRAARDPARPLRRGGSRARRKS